MQTGENKTGSGGTEGRDPLLGRDKRKRERLGKYRIISAQEKNHGLGGGSEKETEKDRNH